jgi:glycosyltransferase involved in cell wall biosynthesis
VTGAHPAGQRGAVVYVLAPQFPWPPNDGGRIGIAYRIRELARRGYRVHLFATAKVDEPVADATPLHEWCASVNVLRRRAGLRALLAWTSLRPFQVTSRDVAAFRDAVRSWHQREPARLVQCEHSSMGAFRDLDLPGPVRWVLTFHNIEYRGAWNRAQSMWKNPLWASLHALEALKLRRYELRLIRSGRFDAWLFVSAREMEEMKRRAGTSGAVFATVQSGSDIPPVPSAARSPHELLFVGSLWYDPNVDGLEWFLREVWPLVRAGDPTATLTVVGRGPTPRVHRLLQHVPGATLIGEVPEVDSWMARAAGVVVPVKRGAGIKVKVVETLARGAPCICTTHALEGLELPPEPVALVADAPAAFAANCLAALRAEPAVLDTARRGRAWVSAEYSWEAVGRRLDGVYRRLLT